MTKPKWWNRRNYTAWYDPHFDISSANYDLHPKHPRPFIDSLKESIRVEGLKNPLVVTLRGDTRTIHPGKCRAKALAEMGSTTAPALVVDYRRAIGPLSIPKGCTFIEHMEQAQDLFTDDNIVQMCHRFLSVSKNA